MSIFKRRKQNTTDLRENEIQAVRQDMFKKVDKANKSMDKLNDLLDNKNTGASERIFYATGGANRKGTK